jgi:PAS domain S-box-containing protein
LVEHSLQGIAVLQGSPLRFVYANSVLARMLDCNLRKLTLLSTKKVGDLFYQEDKDLLAEKLAERFDREPTFSSVELRVLRKHGTIKWLELIENRIELNGQPALQLIFTDITERRKKQEAAIQSEKRYQSLFASISEGFALCEVIVDKAGNPLDYRFLEVNDAYEKQTSLRRADIIGKRVREFLPDVESSWIEILGKVAITGEPIRFENYNHDTNRNYEVFSFSPAKGQFAVLLVDITDRKEKEKENLRQTQEITRIIDGIGDLLFVMDKNRRIIRVNESTCKVFMKKPEDFIGKHCYEIIHGIDRPWHNCPAAKTFETNESVSQEIADPKIGIPLLVTTSPILDENREFIQCVHIAKDITERKKTEAALSVSEEKYRRLFEEAMDAIFLADAETGILIDCNNEAVKLIGKEKSEIVGQHQRFLHPQEENEEKMGQSFKQHLKEQEGCVIETQVVAKNGEIKDVAIKANLIELRGKRLLQGIFRDITDRKKAEELLRASEDNFRTYVESAPVAVFVADSVGKYEYVNEAACKLLGYSREELLKMSIPQVIFKTDIAESLKRLAEVNETGRSVGDFVFKSKDGQPVNISLNVVKLPNGKLVAFCENFTERKKMEQTLREKMDMLEAVTESIGAGLTVISKDYHIVWMNNYLKKLGFTTDKLCYSTFNTLDAMCPDCGVKHIFDGASLDSHEYFNTELAQKGLPPWYELIVSPIKDKDRKVTAALELTLNITEKKVLQQQLAEYSQYLEEMVEQRTAQLHDAQEQLVKSERLAAIGQVAAMVGHDLRNPLTGINGAAYYLKMKLGPNGETKIMQMLDLIENDIQYANKIITDLMEYSKDIKLELTETTPKTIISESISIIQVPETVEIADLTQDTPRIKMDIAKMKRVFANFIKNAIEAMPLGGKLEISSQILGNEVEFKFADTGTGMTEEVINKIWTPFFTTKAKGMGLGLAICRRLIDANQGKVSVESKVGQGTIFMITFPVEIKPRKNGGEKNE